MSCNSYFIATHGSILLDQGGNPLTRRIDPSVLSKFKGKVYFLTFTTPGFQTYIDDRRLLTYYCAMYGNEFIVELVDFINSLPPYDVTGMSDVDFATNILTSGEFKGIYKYSKQILNLINSVKRDAINNINVYTKKSLPPNLILQNDYKDDTYFVMPYNEVISQGFDRSRPLPRADGGGIITISNIESSNANPNIKFAGGQLYLFAKYVADESAFMDYIQNDPSWSRFAFVDSQVKMKIPMDIYNICDVRQEYLMKPDLDPLINIPSNSDPTYMYLNVKMSRYIQETDSTMQTLEDHITRLMDGKPDVYEDVYFIIPSCQTTSIYNVSPGGTYTKGVSVNMPKPQFIAYRKTLAPSRYMKAHTRFVMPAPQTVANKFSPTRTPTIRVSSRRPQYSNRIVEMTYDFNTIIQYRALMQTLEVLHNNCFGVPWSPNEKFGLVTFSKKRGIRGTPDFFFDYCQTPSSYYIFSVCASYISGGPYKRIRYFATECLKLWAESHRDREIQLGVSSMNDIDKFKRLIRLYSNAGFGVVNASCTVGPCTFNFTHVIMSSNRPSRTYTDTEMEDMYRQCQLFNSSCRGAPGIDTSILEDIVINNAPINEPAVQEYILPQVTDPIISFGQLIPSLTPIRRSTEASRRLRQASSVAGPSSASMPRRIDSPEDTLMYDEDEDLIITQGGWI